MSVPAPPVSEIERIAALESPVVRNLEITYCYSRLAAACAERTGKGANWCTYATWASRQAGRTIRGEDLLEQLELKLGESRWLLHPFRTLGRWFLRRGLFQPETRLGRLTSEIHTPFDAFERASDAVARGNLKVFTEIGLQFARYLNGAEPEGDPLLRQAFARYERLESERDPGRRAELAFLGNLEIGFHEQTRLQPQILEALDASTATAEDLGLLARSLQRSSSRLAREVITDCLMVLALPGRVLALRANLPGPYPPGLTDPTDPELKEFLSRFEPAPPAVDDCGAHDWSNLDQRMHYIVHLFRVFHSSEQLSDAPFTDTQVASITRGVIPEGEL